MQTFTATESIKWRVLNINNKGTIDLISENEIKTSDETNSNFILKGTIGYLYAEQELNEVCKIFGFGYGADTSIITNYEVGGPKDTPISGKIQNSGARSITIEDINKKAGIEEKDGKVLDINGRVINSNYGSTANPTVDVYYPTLYTDTGISSSRIKNLEYTFYYYDKSRIQNKDLEGILFNENYWIASRSFSSNPNYIAYKVHNMKGDSMAGSDYLCHGDASRLVQYANNSYAVRPIVTLKYNSIDIKNSREYNGVKMWELK